MSSARASICAWVSSCTPSGAVTPEWHVAHRCSTIGWISAKGDRLRPAWARPPAGATRRARRCLRWPQRGSTTPTPGVPAVEEDADERGQHGDEDEDEPRLVRAEDEREVPDEHREDHGQGEVVVVNRLCPWRGAGGASGSRFSSIARTSFRCAGMITRRTFATMIVPSIAPTWRYAARAAKSSSRPRRRARRARFRRRRAPPGSVGRRSGRGRRRRSRRGRGHRRRARSPARRPGPRRPGRQA